LKLLLHAQEPALPPTHKIRNGNCCTQAPANTCLHLLVREYMSTCTHGKSAAGCQWHRQIGCLQMPVMNVMYPVQAQLPAPQSMWLFLIQDAQCAKAVLDSHLKRKSMVASLEKARSAKQRCQRGTAAPSSPQHFGVSPRSRWLLGEQPVLACDQSLPCTRSDLKVKPWIWPAHSHPQVSLPPWTPALCTLTSSGLCTLTSSGLLAPLDPSNLRMLPEMLPLLLWPSKEGGPRAPEDGRLSRKSPAARARARVCVCANAQSLEML